MKDKSRMLITYLCHLFFIIFFIIIIYFFDNLWKTNHGCLSLIYVVHHTCQFYLNFLLKHFPLSGQGMFISSNMFVVFNHIHRLRALILSRSLFFSFELRLRFYLGLNGNLTLISRVRNIVMYRLLAYHFLITLIYRFLTPGINKLFNLFNQTFQYCLCIMIRLTLTIMCYMTAKWGLNGFKQWTTWITFVTK